MNFDFVDRSGLPARAVEQLRGEAFWLDDQRIAAPLGRHVPAVSADLLTLAMCCYAADRVAPRPRTWHRELTVRIPVRDTGLLPHAIPRLERWLEVLTDDRWRIEVARNRRARAVESQLLLELPDRDWDAVGLFSGGLDSFAGATTWLEANRGGGLILVGAQSSSVVGAIQRRQARRLQQVFPARVVLIGVPLHLDRTLSRDRWQRSRGFLYEALAVVVADLARVPAILVFENGYGALNPRLGEQQHGAYATKSTHPWVLEQWTAWTRALGYTASTRLPHRWDTKAELVARIPVGLRDGIRETASCDAFPLRRPRQKQCGICGSCVLRRQSLVAAGLVQHDRDDYAADPLGGSDVARLMAFQAWQFRSLRPDGALSSGRRWPELSIGLDDQPSLEAEMNLALLRRYGAEWAAIAEADPVRGAELRWTSDAARVA